MTKVMDGLSRCHSDLFDYVVNSVSAVKITLIRHPRLSAAVRGQMFTRVLVTQKFGQIFTEELELGNEDSIIIGGELFLLGNNFSKFSPRFACLQLRFDL